MEDDRELLELAAKAAGIYLEWDGDPAKWQPMYYEGKTYHAWEPLTDDGDALRLAVKLAITDLALVVGDLVLAEGFQGDKYAATRRAIVRAAAEMGKAM